MGKHFEIFIILDELFWIKHEPDYMMIFLDFF